MESHSRRGEKQAMNAEIAKKRLTEFVWYHINGDGDCNGQTLKAYAGMKHLQTQDMFDLAYFYAMVRQKLARRGGI